MLTKTKTVWLVEAMSYDTAYELLKMLGRVF